MNKTSTPVNIIQLVVAAAKLILYFVLPVVSFTVSIIVVSFSYGFKPMDIYNATGNFMLLLPLILYGVLLIFTVNPLQKFSMFAAAAVLIVEIVLLIMAPKMISIDSLLEMIRSAVDPDVYANISTYLQGAKMLLESFMKPGLGLIINLILTVVYGAGQFIAGGFGGGSGSGTGSGRTTSPAPFRSSSNSGSSSDNSDLL